MHVSVSILPQLDPRLWNVLFQLIKSKEKYVQRSGSEPWICTVSLPAALHVRFILIVRARVHVSVFCSLSTGVYFNCSQRGQSSCGRLGERKKKNCCNQRLLRDDFFF